MEYLKILLIYIARIIMSGFCVFPVKKERYFFCAYDGKSISCNPLYFNRYLIEKKIKAEYIWAVQDKKKVYIPDDLKGKIKLVKTGSFEYFFYGYTSEYVIYNLGLYKGSLFRKRKGQYFVNTWHAGGAYKKVSGQTNISKKERFVEKLCGRQIDFFLSTNKWFSDVMTVAESVPRERFLEVGIPRNDFLIQGNKDGIREKVYSYFGLEETTSIALYAPTYRGNTHNAKGVMELDCDKLKNSLEKRFGGKWIILVRMHYFVKAETQEGLIDASAYNDMQELLYVAAVLITDYSSSIWDFSLMDKPAFLLTTDLIDYESERAFYTPIEKWQYPHASTNKELCELVLKYDPDSMRKKIRDHQELLGNCETGKASEYLYKALHKKGGNVK